MHIRFASCYIIIRLENKKSHLVRFLMFLSLFFPWRDYNVSTLPADDVQLCVHGFCDYRFADQWTENLQQRQDWQGTATYCYRKYLLYLLLHFQTHVDFRLDLHNRSNSSIFEGRISRQYILLLLLLLFIYLRAPMITMDITILS